MEKFDTRIRHRQVVRTCKASPGSKKNQTFEWSSRQEGLLGRFRMRRSLRRSFDEFVKCRGVGDEINAAITIHMLMKTSAIGPCEDVPTKHVPALCNVNKLFYDLHILIFV